MTIAFSEVIYELATICGAVRHEGTPTAITSTTLADTVMLAGHADDALIGAHVYIYRGPGVGQERRISDSTGSTSLVTVSAWDAPIPVLQQSRYIILHEGWTMEHFRVAFRNAMRSLRRSYLVPKWNEDLTLAASAGVATAEYNLPGGYAAIESVWRERNDGDGDFNIPFPADTWYIGKEATRKLILSKEAIDKLSDFFKDGYAIQIRGQAYETEPDDDSDTLMIPTGVLSHLAASMALNSARVRDVNNTQGYGQLASIQYQQWLKLRSDVDDETRITPGSKMVDE